MSRCLPFPPQDYQLLSSAEYETIKEKLKTLKSDKRQIIKRREKKKAYKNQSSNKRLCTKEAETVGSISCLTDECVGPASSGESTENSNKRNRMSCDEMDLTKNGKSLNENLIDNNVNWTALSSADDKERENVTFNLEEIIKICEELKTDVDICPTDQDWLFQGKDERSNKRQRSGDFTVMPCSNGSTLYPRAQYIKEADIYALPYVLLF